MKLYDIPASIKLAQAILESAAVRVNYQKMRIIILELNVTAHGKVKRFLWTMIKE